jgi:hypothetical protein
LGPRTLTRCAVALKLWQKNPYDYLIVSGGIYELPHLQTVPAACIMRDWFILQRVDEGRIIVEKHSLDTFENVRFSLAMLQAMNVPVFDLEIVTQRQHATRFWITLVLGYRRSPTLHRLEYSMTRMEKFKEFLFLLIHLCWPKTGGPLGEKNRRERNQGRRSL